MPLKNSLKIEFRITLKKVISSKVNLFFLIGFPIFLFYIWQKDSIETSLNFFLFLYPYLFLFLTQNMVKDEIDKGCLENVLFIRADFKDYLVKKNLSLIFIGILCSLIFFVFFASYELLTHEFSIIYFYQFLIGILVGIYYVFIGIFLSFYLKGGSNVLSLIIAQLFVLVGFILSATKNSILLDCIDKGVFPNLVSKIKFLALIVLFPNLTISKKFLIYSVEILALCLILYFLQKIKIQKLELTRK